MATHATTFSPARPFAFDRVFSSVAAPAIDQDLPARIAELEADAARTAAAHDTALAYAREQAFEAGLALARAERETALLAAIDALQASLENVDAQIAEATTRVTADAAHIALAAADHLAARALAAEPAAAIDEAIGRVLSQIARGTEVQVRVHPDVVEDAESVIGVRQEGDRRLLALHVIGDATVSPGDASIAWDGGGLALDAAARVAAVREELATLLEG